MEESIQIAKRVISVEIDGLEYMQKNLDNSISIAVDTIVNSNGRVIVCGMGKSGIVGKKIAASLASTGTASFFMHPGEAFHGDLGMIKSEDVFIAISNSGETDEVLKLLPFLRDNGNYIISMTGNELSTLAKNSECHLSIKIPKEACPLKLAPTTSTTATMVMGDALTIALMERRGFKSENFARFHPGGDLGRRLLSKVKDEAIYDNLPIVESNSTFQEVINSITETNLGIVLVFESGKLFGVLTDGDIRRAMVQFARDVFSLKAKDFASINPVTIHETCKVDEAMQLMTKKGITTLVVLSQNSNYGIMKK